jgi:hypothetical protein
MHYPEKPAPGGGGVGAGNVPTERKRCRNGQFSFGKGTYTNDVPIFYM